MILFLIIVSCKKEQIPEPDVNPVPSSVMPLFISGVFDGTDELREIDGVNYIADSYAFHTEPNDEVTWYFDLHNEDALGLAEISIGITNHCFCPVFSFADLQYTTDTTSLSFWNLYDPDPFQQNRVMVEYMDDNGTCYSSIIDTNTPMSVLSSMDTIVNNEQFRILELSGSFMLTDLNGTSTINVDDFNARIALSL